MAKLVLLFFTILACNVLALPMNTIDTDQIKINLQKVRDEAINSVDTLNLDNVDRRRAIVSHSSEFAHRIQETINMIFKIFVRVDERYSHRFLPQVALRLNDIVHEIQEVLISKPTILKSTLKENVNKASEQVTKLIDVLQHFTENKDEGKLKQDVNNIIDKLIDAIHQLRIRSDVHHQTNDVNAKSYQNLGNEIVNALNKITWSDDDTYDLLVNIVKNFDHTLNHILYHFQREIFHFGNNDFNDIVRRMQEIRLQLQTVLNRDDYRSVTRKIEDLKTQLRLTVHNFDVQIQKLVKVTSVPSDSRTLPMENCVKNILADSFNVEQRVLSKLREILSNNRLMNTV